MKGNDPVTPEMGYMLFIETLCFLLMVPMLLLPFMPSVELYEIVIALLMILTFCARRQKGAGSLNGCGTKFYGDRCTEHGSITTKWITVCHLPIVPIRSYFLYSGEAPPSDKVQNIEVANFTADLVPSGEIVKVFVCPLPQLFWPQVLPILILPILLFGVVPACLWGVIFKK